LRGEIRTIGERLDGHEERIGRLEKRA